MTLYLYRIGTEVPILTIENVQNYTADSVTARNAEGNPIVYSPLAADCELSSKADCSETLRADWHSFVRTYTSDVNFVCGCIVPGLHST